MGSQSTTLTGPDLKQGVPTDSVPPDGMLLGHVDGEAVLLIRRSEAFHAVGASCPHYGAPLVEGKLVGDELRCPWHHATFDLTTGAACAPALNPLPCWQVEVRDGRVSVRGKKAAGRPPARKTDVSSIVIVGGGTAGNAAAERLRQKGFEGKITVLSADRTVPCDKPNLSKDYLAGRAPEEWLPLRSEAFYRESEIDLRLGTQALSLDPKKKLVATDQGETIPFDRCLLAMGATPRRLPVEGHDHPHVFYLRTLDDCRKIIARLGEAKKAVVVGSGFIGLEVAASLRTRGLDVAVVSSDAVPLQRVMGREIGGFLQKVHETNGVSFHLGRTVAEIRTHEIRLDSGEVVAADLVIIGIGVIPDVGIAGNAGLHLGGGGIEVDSYLETSAPGIYAAGDLAFWKDARLGERMRVEHWVVAGRQGQTAAGNMLGEHEPFRAVPFFWTAQFDAALSYVGYAPVWNEIKIKGSIEARDATIGFLAHGKVRAVATLGRDADSLEAEAAFQESDNARLLKLLG